jgi:hypothetical protein
MQDRYVGDVGDFAKYALLRSIGQGRQPLRLGVIWYLYPNETHNSDGGNVSYLDAEDYRALDPELHEAMNRLVRGDRRRVAEVRKAAVLPRGTVFFEEPIVGELGLGAAATRREAFRIDWFRRAQAAVSEADIVFLDPDNGIEVPSVPKCAPKAGKYAFWDEIEGIWARGHSLLIYHHLNRTMTADRQTHVIAKKLAELLRHPPLVLPQLFRRGSCRHFWLIGQPVHASALRSGISAFHCSGWREHFHVG